MLLKPDSTLFIVSTMNVFPVPVPEVWGCFAQHDRVAFFGNPLQPNLTHSLMFNRTGCIATGKTRRGKRWISTWIATNNGIAC